MSENTNNPTSENELYEKILDDIDARSDWEGQQILWHKMRHDGVKRSRKPWAGAADMHVPIGDTIISKLKAYYMQWIFGPELLASFYSLDQTGDSYQDAVARWFDYQLRECSNFTPAAMIALDSLLQNGMGFMKTYWDSDREQLAFSPIHPYFIIVPPWTTDIHRADRVTHVMHMSEDDYRRSGKNCGYNMDEDFIDSIKGEGKPDNKMREQQASAEGLSYSKLKDLIILWEVYKRGDDNQIEVQTFSPLMPDEPARDTFKMPYDHKQVPICLLPYELMDSGFYSSRGVMELVQMFEASACKMWNEKLDYMSIANRPVLSSQGGSVNAQNIRWEPGAVYDAILQLVQQPPPPVDFDREVQNNRSIAEQRVGIPDFGIGQDNQQDKSRTATEVNSITNVMQQSNDLRARVTKGSMSQVYYQAWSILQQFKRKDLDYFWRRQRITLDDAAFDNKYLLTPNGSVDGYSRDKEVQKLMQLRQLAQGSPWLKLNEIDRKIVELMDSSWIVEVYQEPEQASANQQEDQAIENTVMTDGFLPQVLPTDDHLVHCQMIDGFITFSQQKQRPIPPDAMMLLMQHGMAHVQAARQDPQYMRNHGTDIEQIGQKFATTLKQLQSQQQAGQTAQTGLGHLRGQPQLPTMRGGAPPLAPPPPGAQPPPLPTPGANPGNGQLAPNPTNGAAP